MRQYMMMIWAMLALMMAGCQPEPEACEGQPEQCASTGATSGTQSTGTTDEPTTTPTGGMSFCGDGDVGPEEECDEGSKNGDSQACKADCTFNVCGDGDVGPGEGCDDGNSSDDDACLSTCQVASCGDKFVQLGIEQCDEGTENGPGKACKANCTFNLCGDGDVGPDEECDLAGENNNSGECTLACQKAACGDGFLQGDEECDDGNLPGEMCSNECRKGECSIVSNQEVGFWTEEDETITDCTCDPNHPPKCHILHQSMLNSIDGNLASMSLRKMDGTKPSVDLGVWIAAIDMAEPICYHLDTYPVRESALWKGGQLEVKVANIPIWKTQAEFDAAPEGAEKWLLGITGGGDLPRNQMKKIWQQDPPTKFTKVCKKAQGLQRN